MADKLKLIPYPSKVEFKDGIADCSIVKLCNDAVVNGFDVKDFLVKYGVKTADDGLPVTFELSDVSVKEKEGYRLDICNDKIGIEACAPCGLLYAFVTLVQLINNYSGRIPCCRIDDAPEISYRGFMLDSGRYFFTKPDVLKIIDLCFLNKINVFHWHLTEDQGWRIQIDKYPLLTEKGSVRSHTNFGFRPHGGYYTKQDVKDIIGYCRARNIEVIPEFDIPGHSQAALACYPWLGCFDRKLEVATHSGVKHDILCAGKESTYRFVFDVIDEIAEMFKDSRYIHLGGDEAVKTRWKICPHCQKKMKELGIEKEDALQAYFMERVAGYVADKGFTPIMWNETDLSLPCHDKMVWQLWTTGNGVVKTEDIVSAACSRGGIINSDSAYVYVDLPYADINLEKSYAFKPVPEGAGDKFIGAEIALWSEYVPDFATACRRMLPRALAIAEAMWGKHGEDFDGFCKRLDATQEFLERAGYKGVSGKTAMPGKVRAFFQKMWFERRQLHWQGLHNLIDNAVVKIKYSSER